MTEAHSATMRRVPRPLTLGSMVALILALIVGLSPAIAASGPTGRDRTHASADARQRGTAEPTVLASAVLGPARVTLGLGSLFTTQFDGSRFANGNCNMAAGAMLFEVQTGRIATGALMRRWSGARTRGTNLGDLRRAFARQGQRLETREDMSWTSFMREVGSGRSAVVQGWYGSLTGKVNLQPGYSGVHSVFVLGYSRHALRGRGGFYVMDPLGSGSYDGAWWSRATLHRFGWSGSPNTVGIGRTAFYGNVALQARPTRKRLSERAYRPAFQSYWDTSKALIRRARSVNVLGSGKGRKSALVVRVRDPHLKLRLRRAAQRNVAWPLASRKSSRAVRVQGRKVVVTAGPYAKVVAAASGRVVYRSWTLRGGKTLWIQHGPRLFTVYQGLDRLTVEPGQWVRRGKVLGRVHVTTVKKGTKTGKLRFSIAVGRSPQESARVGPARFLPGRLGAVH